MVNYSRVVRPIPWSGSGTRGASGGENVSSDAFISVAEIGHGIVGLGFVDGIEVVSVGALVGSVEGNGLDLLGWEDVAGYALGGVAERGGCAVHLCFICGVEVVGGSWTVCTVERDCLVWVWACGGWWRTNLKLSQKFMVKPCQSQRTNNSGTPTVSEPSRQ